MPATAHLEVDDNSKHKNSGWQVEQVGQVVAIKGLTKGSDLVGTCGQEMK